MHVSILCTNIDKHGLFNNYNRLGLWRNSKAMESVNTLVWLVVGVFVLVAGDVSGGVDELLAAGDALALAGGVEALLVRAGVLARVRQSVHGGGGRGRLW